MATAWLNFPRIELKDLLPFLSPGTIVGVYDDAGWLNWEIERTTPVEILSIYDLLSRPAGDPALFHCVILGASCAVSAAGLSGSLAVLLQSSRGLALVASRVGMLLQVAHRILCPVRDRRSGPHGRRSSGGWPAPTPAATPGSWRLLDPADLARQALLSLQVADSRAAVRAIEGSSSVRVSADLVHVALEGGTPEEILERLRSHDIRVNGSAVWYPALQSSPFERDLAGH
jgi:hypothetical protein